MTKKIVYTKCCCGYEGLFHQYANRITKALKPAVKMWQKKHKEPLTWPDPAKLIEWLIKEAK